MPLGVSRHTWVGLYALGALAIDAAEAPSTPLINSTMLSTAQRILDLFISSHSSMHTSTLIVLYPPIFHKSKSKHLISLFNEYR